MALSYQALTDDQIRRQAPSVFAPAADLKMSDRYAYIPTSVILDGLRAEGFEPTVANQSMVRSQNKDFAFHMLRFRHKDSMNLAKVGDEIPELVLTNSHDGSSAYSLTAGFFRLICLNGMVVGNPRNEISVKHAGNIIDNVIEGSFRVIEETKALMPKVELWKSIRLDADERELFSAAALQIRYPEVAPISATALLNVRRPADRSNDLWTQFNVVQENIIRGGIRGIGNTSRRMTTRKISSIKEDLKINKALWNLTSGMAEFLQPS